MSIGKSLLSLVADAYAVPLMRVCVVVGVLCLSLLCSSLRVLFLFSVIFYISFILIFSLVPYTTLD
jgi:hypothetical protein